MSFVAADLGASSTRYTSDSGKIDVLPNNMKTLPDMNVSLIIPDSGDIESCLEAQITRDGQDAMGFFPTNVLMGIMAEKHRGIDERPSVNTHKHKQKINYVSAIMACAVSKLKHPELAEHLDLYLATPPIEVHAAKEAFAQVLCGTYTVYFPKYNNGVSVTFTVDSVKCYAESYMASAAFFFNMNGTPKEETRQYLSGTVLHLDIGASTSDLSITKNGKFLDKSGQTYRIGGNVARDNLTDQICQKFAIDLPLADAEKVMAEGRMQQGMGFVDVSDLVMVAKRELAQQLNEYLDTYFKRIQIPIQMVNAIVVSGGGSMQSQYATPEGEMVKTSEPLSYFVTQELQTWSPGTAVIPFGENARFANVTGLFIRAKIDEIKRRQQAAVASQPVTPTVQSVAQGVGQTQQVQQAVNNGAVAGAGQTAGQTTPTYIGAPGQVMQDRQPGQEGQITQ